MEKARYLPKLEALGMTLPEVDPYFKESGKNFEANVIIWPPLEYSHIFGYLITYPGLYILSNSSYPANNYMVITMLEPYILGGLGMEEVR